MYIFSGKDFFACNFLFNTLLSLDKIEKAILNGGEVFKLSCDVGRYVQTRCKWKDPDGVGFHLCLFQLSAPGLSNDYRAMPILCEENGSAFPFESKIMDGQERLITWNCHFGHTHLPGY